MADDDIYFMEDNPQTEVSVNYLGTTYTGTYFVEEGHVRATFEDQRGNIRNPSRAIGDRDAHEVAKDTILDIVKLMRG